MCYGDLFEVFSLLYASRRIRSLKQLGHKGKGIVSHEPSSNLIFITSSSLKTAPHFSHFLLEIKSLAFFVVDLFLFTAYPP
jgi:hypothetical protein